MKSTSRKPDNNAIPITEQDLNTYPWLRVIVSKIHLHTWTDVDTFCDVARDTYRETLENARRELAAAQAERDAINKRIARLERIVESIAEHVDSELGEGAKDGKPLASGDTGFSDAVRFALKGGKELTPVEVKEKMEMLGYNFGRYESDPLASIHTILKRLTKQGEVEKREWPHNQTTYKFLRVGQRGANTNAAATNADDK